MRFIKNVTYLRFEYTDTTGAVIVKQSNGSYVRGVSQAVVELTETVGSIPVPSPPTTPPAAAPQQLKNYELLLYSVGTTYGCITPIPVSDSALPDPTDPYGRLVWQIDPSQQLLPGSYVLRFSPPPSDTLCVLRPEVSMDRGSAEKSSSSRFWMTIESPKVTTSDGSGSRPSVPLST